MRTANQFIALLTALSSLLLFVQLSEASQAHLAGLRGQKPKALAERKLIRQRKEMERALALSQDKKLTKRWNDTLAGGGYYRFLNNKTQPYYVDSLPEVDFDLGEIYSGLVPIDYSNTSEALFFVFQPKLGEPVDEVTIWLNGGPGCSSLEGFFQENGLYIWPTGTYEPFRNEYAWVNLTNMLWVEQPIGTGFSIGAPKATTEEEIAEDFVKWFKNWQDVFGIKNYKIYVTGESYAGRYVSYISAAMLDQNDTMAYNLSGAMVYDPCIGEFDSIQEEYVAYPFIEANNNLFNFNSTIMSALQDIHESCGYADYLNKFYTFPPSSQQPPLFFNATDNIRCDIFDIAFNHALNINPCFNIYEITTMCPLQFDPLGFPGSLDYIPPDFEIYFNRSDVKAALHAPDYVSWTVCSVEPVFVGGNSGPQSEGDISADPIQKVLPQVIEATNRVLIANGDYDMIIITNGTLLSIQNMTWNGKLGFQSQPNMTIDLEGIDVQWAEIFAENDEYPPILGTVGIQHYERGLMWAETYQSGHMQPQYQPSVTYRHLQWLLGHVETL